MKDIKETISYLDMIATNLIGEVANGNKSAIKYQNALDSAIHILSKQLPYKPMLMQLQNPEYMCLCGHKFYASHKINENSKYCSSCGQLLDWSDVEYSKRDTD